jgi:hypothetical protein
MPTFNVLEHIQSRMEDSSKRLAIATQNLQRAQQEHQMATHEHSIWTGALQIEQRKIALAQAQAHAQQQQQARALSPGSAATHSEPKVLQQPVATSIEPNTGQDINKTEAIREFLSKRSTGVTPAEIWETLKGQVDRPYVYSILKRLKDRKQVTVRRGKYYLVIAPKSEEGKQLLQ